MLALSLASLRHQSRRYLAPGLAVILGIAFIAATLVLTGTLNSTMRQAVAGQYAPYAAVVVPAEERGTIPEGVADKVADAPGVESVDAVRTGNALARTSTGETYAMVTTDSSLTRDQLIKGSLSSSADEVVISEGGAAATGAAVGDSVPFVPMEGQAKGASQAEVVGVVDVSDNPRYRGGASAVLTSPEGVSRLTGATGWTEIDVVAPGDEEEVADAVASTLPTKGAGAPTVLPATEHADNQVAEFTGGTDMLASFFLAFAVIALFVSTIVIGNTFTILLARRARETAMLRAIGSTRRQVMGSALLEALVVGVVASVVGVLAGIGLARGLVALLTTFAADSLPEVVFTVPSRAIWVPATAGVLVVLVAAVRPVIRSSRVAPLAALRPDAAMTARSRRGLVRIGAGALLFAAGVLALVVAAARHSVPIGVVGGLVSFTGVILTATVLVPWATRIIGLVAARPFGPAGRMAVDNAVRNPARAAATASALLVGVTLVTMTAVGASTARSTVTDYVNAQYPIDVVVQAQDLSSADVRSLERVDGVDAGATLGGTNAAVAGHDVRLAAVPPEISSVVRSDDAMPDVPAGSVVVSSETAAEAGVDQGEQVTLRGPAGSTTADVVVDGSLEQMWLVTPGTMSGLDGTPATSSLFLRLEDGADVQAVMTDVQEVAAGIEGSSVGGGAPVRSANMQALDMALGVVLALLAISVIIAVVGIANTLSLSVIERTRESALLRALGLTRGQLRGMLAIESVLLALVGVVVGSLLGIGYAFVGVTALFGPFTSVGLALPAGQLVAIVLVAVVAALGASVLPARRAAKVSPAAALAAE